VTTVPDLSRRAEIIAVVEHSADRRRRTEVLRASVEDEAHKGVELILSKWDFDIMVCVELVFRFANVMAKSPFPLGQSDTIFVFLAVSGSDGTSM
jgi:hypothetical protein